MYLTHELTLVPFLKVSHSVLIQTLNKRFLKVLCRQNITYLETSFCPLHRAQRPAFSTSPMTYFGGMENQEITTMLILDLLAAFDTVDHDILLTILEQTFSFKEKALKWFDNYLRPRYFKVCIDGRYSESKNLTFSILQGSCSGTNLFSCYCSLITTAIPNSLEINRFADDHSIRAKYKASNTTRAGETMEKLEKHTQQ